MKTNHTLILRITLGVIIILLAGFSALQMIPPRAVPAEAPATDFSAQRAMADLQVVAREPHPAGSDAQAKVRTYILEQVEALGLNAEVETSSRISNILVRLPGYDSSQTVLITGHYDSAIAAPGAGDDGISVVAMLESIRVLHARSNLRNDILFLFTDGEELGWIGALSYLKNHPEAKNETGVLLVFDARPGNAPLSLLETSPGDAWLIRHMTGLSLPLWASSWKNLQERGEKNTDYDVLQPAGYIGIAMENEATGTRYHTPRDSADAISPNLVQTYGQTMITLANRFGTIDLHTRTEGPDLAFFSLSLVGLIAYPYWLMITFSSMGILALLFLVIIALRRGSFSPKRFLLSVSGLLLGSVVIVLLSQLIWKVIKTNQGAQIAVDEGFEGSSLWQAILMGVAAALMIVLLYFLSRRFGVIHQAAAAPMIFLIVGFAFNSLTKTDNPLSTAWIAWPFLGGVAGLGTLLLIKHPVWKVVLLSLAALMVMAVAIPRLWMGTYTREDAWLTVTVICVWIPLLAPQVEAVFGQPETGTLNK